MTGARHRSKLRPHEARNDAKRTGRYACTPCNVSCSSEQDFTAHLDSPANRRLHNFALQLDGNPTDARTGNRSNLVSANVNAAAILSKAHSPQNMLCTEKAPQGIPHPRRISTSPDVSVSSRAIFKYSTNESRPIGPSTSSWRTASSSSTKAPLPAASVPRGQSKLDALKRRTARNPKPSRMQPGKKKGTFDGLACSTCHVVCNSQKSLNEHLKSAKHERAVLVTRDKAAQNTTSMVLSNAAEVVEDNSPPEGFSVRQIAGTVVRVGARNLPIEVGSSVTPARPWHRLDIVSGPSFEMTPTSRMQGESVAENNFLELGLHRLDSVEIAPRSKLNSHNVANGGDATTQTLRSSLVLAPTVISFANKGLRGLALAVLTGSGAEKKCKEGELIYAPRPGVISTLAKAVDKMTSKKKQCSYIVPQKSAAEIDAVRCERTCLPQLSAVAARKEENETERQVSEQMGDIDDEVPGILRVLEDGRVAKNNIEGLTGMNTIADDASEFENARKQDENSVVITASMIQSSGIGGSNAKEGASDAQNLKAWSVTSGRKRKKNKRKKSKRRVSSPSPTLKKDLSQWYCGMCHVQCNSDAPFQRHLKSTRHSELLQGPTASKADGIVTRRSLSSSFSATKCRNPPVTVLRIPQQVEEQKSAPVKPFYSSFSPAEPSSRGLPSAVASFPHLFLENEANTSIIVVCDVCKVPYSGQEYYSAHMSGKQHAICTRKLQEVQV